MHLLAYSRLRRIRNLIFAALLTALAAAARQPQIISFAPIPDQLFGVSPFPIAAHADSHLPVVFSSDTASVCEVSGSWVLPLTVGNCTVRASRPGNSDYAAATSLTQTFSITASLPAGTMKSGSQLSIPSNPNGVAVADFNHDGYPDAAITSLGSTLTIAFGGASGIASTSSITLAASVYAVAAADLNADGNPDLVVAAKNTDGATVIIPVIGQGTGVLTPQTAIALANASTPTGLAVGNFNVGGNQDVAVADGNGRVTVLRGDGFGNLTPASSFSPLLGAIKGIVSADVNHDGFMDLIFACPAVNQVVIYKANSEGSFSLAGQYLLGPSAGQNALAVGDFNNDGNVDFAVTLGVAGEVAFYTSDASGSFQRTGALTTVGSAPMSIVAGDFNGDGKQDLAVGGSGGVYFLLGNGAGAFTAAAAQPNYPVFTSGNVFLATGDFNGDSREDVLTVNDASAALVVLSGALAHTTTTLSTTAASLVLQGTSVPLTATVTPPDQYFSALTGGSVRFYDNSNLLTTISGNSPYLYTVPSLSAGDHTLTANYSAPAGFDGSASQELPITASTKQPQTITFSPLSDRPMSPLPIQLTATSDSHLTVSFSSTTTSICTVEGSLLTLRGVGQCSITASQPGNDTTYNAATPVVRQFNISIASQRIRTGSVLHPTVGLPPFEFPVQADSLLPVSLTSLTPSVCRLAASLVTPLAAGTCTIEASQAGNANYNPAPTVDKSFEVKLAKASGVLTPGTSIPLEGASPVRLATGDFNGDGFSDLAIVNPASSSVSILLGDASGAFHPLSATFPTPGNPVAVVTGDFNADGYSDLAVSTIGDGSIAVLLGGPGGALTPASGSPFAPGANALAMAVGDFNGDGIEDLATADSPGGDARSGGSLAIWAGNGQGGFNQVSQTTFDGLLIGLAVGDFDKNGKQDVAAVGFPNSQVFILLGNGNGGFLDSPAAVSVGTVPVGISVGDFDANGNPDLAVASLNDNAITVLIGDGGGGFQAVPSLTVTGSQTGALAVGDFNGDGLADIGVSTNDGFTLLKNNGSLNFVQAAGSPFALGVPSELVTGDFNNDGRLDVAAMDQTSHQISILLGAAAPTTSTLSITSPVPALLGSTVSLKLTVASTGTSINPVSGTATIVVGGATLFTAPESTSPFTFQTSGFFAGEHTLTAHFAGANGNADSDSNSVTFDMQESQTISFGPLSDVALVKSPFQISAAATSALAVTFSSGNTSVCKVAGTTVTLVAAGTCTLYADQAGNSSWAPAARVTVQFTVNATAPQTITFPAIPDQRYGAPPFVVPAKSDSGLTVSLASKTLDVCSTAGTLVTILMPGSCRIEAAQTGNVSYDAATSVTREFLIQNAAPAGILTALPASPISIGTDPKGVAAADLNHDGVIDFIVADNAVDKVTVLLADGNGGYNATHFDTGHLPAGVTIADFDRDGNADFAVVNTSNTVTVYRGDGHGAFTQVSGSPFSAGLTSPNRAVAGDFDGDGIPDLAVSADSGTSFAILSGVGDGTFHTGTLHSVSATPLAIAVGDFNRDGRQDLAIALSDNTVAVLNGSSEGGFTPDTHGPFATGAAPVAILADDFNNDGKTDLATANKTDGTVSILIGDGAGNFTKPNDPVAAGASPTSLAAGDYNGDGFVDLVVAHNSSVGVLLNNGDGSFRTGPNFGVASGVPDTVAAADLNNDGAIDLAVTNQSGGKLTLFRGATNPTQTTLSTTSPLTVTTGAQISFAIAVAHTGAAEYELPHGSVTVSDNAHLLDSTAQTVTPYTFTTPALTAGSHVFTAAYSGDQRSGASASDSVTIVALTPQTITFGPLSNKILGSGQVTLTATASSGLAVTYSTNSTACNVSSGVVTLLSAGSCAIKASQPGDLTLWAAAPDVTQSFTITQTQTITFTPILSHFAGDSPFPVTAKASSGLPVILTSTTTPICKLTGDLVVAVSAGTCTLQATQSGNDAFEPATPATRTFAVRAAARSGAFTSSFGPYSTGAGPVAVALADFNGDGLADFVTANSQAKTVTVMLANSESPAGSFSVGGSPISVATGDFNGDGKQDIAVLTNDSSLAILLGRGDGSFDNGPSVTVGSAAQSMAIGDVDGGNIEDIVVAEAGLNQVRILKGDGSGHFTSTLVDAGNSPEAVALGDFDGDGVPDIAVANNDGHATVLTNHLANGFTASSFTTDNGSNTIVAADFNNDGKLDLAVGNAGTSTVTFLINGGSSSVSLPAPPESLSVGDFNGDGAPDLAIVTSSGVVTALGAGDGTFTTQLGGNFAADLSPTSGITGDFDNDGYLDLLTVTASTNQVHFLSGGPAIVSVFLATTAGASVPLGTAVPLTATITPTTPVFKAPSGSVTFLDGDSPLGTASQSPYTFTATGLTQRTHSFFTSYEGDAQTAPATSDTLSVAVVPLTPQSITFGPLSDKIKGSGNVTLTASASSGLAVTFSTASSACSVTENIVTLNSAGVCSIKASQAGNSIYAPAPDVVQDFTISLPQIISFDTIPDQIFGTSPFTTAARASSGLGITLTSLTSNVCKTARDLITVLSSGTCQIQATQPGGSDYAPATPVTQTFTVRSAAPGGAFISLTPIAAGVSARAAVAGDFNGDHTPDLAVADASVAGNVTVLLGPDFSATSAHAVGSTPVSIAVGDFDVDGRLDLVTPNQADNSVSVLHGEGVTTLNGFNSPQAVAIGDFNGDGWQDLAVVNGAANNVSVVSFNGQEFIPVNTFATGTQPSAIALGDFNGDGKQDLAIANQSSNDVTVLLGDGAGNFAAAPGSPYAVGAAPVHLVAGDFNLDGVSDLAVANSGGTGSISVLKGNGDGSFTAFPGGAPGSGKFQAVAVSDFNGDGKPDIAGATDAQSGSVSVFLGDGNGGFSALPSTFAVGSFPTGLIAADLNGDGVADLVATNSGDGTVSVLLGAASQTITFAPISPVQTGAHIDLNATASSGLAVTFASSTPSVCTVSGTSATAISAGTCTIVASQAGDNAHPPASASLSFAVTDPPPAPPAPQTISFSSLGTVAFGSPAFAITATASSGLPVTLSSGTPAVCSVASSTVSVLSAGTCSITATQNGNSAFLAADPVTQSFTVLTAVTITTSSLSNGIAGAGYSATVAATGGTGGPYSWSVTAGSLPQGISLGSNGLLTGNSGTAGTFTFTAQASDGVSTPARASLSITVFGQLSITTTSLPNGTAGSAYGPQPITAQGGSGSFTWTASGLPGGLGLSSSGSLSGTPTAAGNFGASFTATDTNTAQTLTVTIPLSIVPAATILKVSPSSLTAGAAAGGAITGSFTASGGVPPYQFSATGLPAGIGLSQSGALSGSSSATGSYSAAVTITDSATPPTTGTAQLTVNIFGITATSLSNGVATVFYSSAFQVSGGTPPIVFSATGLPAGLSLSGNGSLSGTVATSGTFNFTVQASDSSGLTSSRDFNLTMDKAPVSAKAFSLPDGTVGSPYSGSLTPSGGTAPYSWSVISGVLPAGLSLSPSGVVSGIPTAPGASTIGAQVTDATGGVASGAVSITIAPAPFGVSTGPLPSGVVDFYYGPQIVDVTGGTAPYTFELSGNLPPGLSLDGNVISGTPSTAGTFAFSLKVTDAAGKQADAAASILIRPPTSDLVLLSGSVSFSLAQGATLLPAAQSVGVQSTVVADSITYSASATAGAGWLAVTGGGTTPGAVSLALTDAALSLPVGSNFATVTVTCTSSTCQGKSQTIVVSLNISSPPPQLSVGDSLLSFNSVSALSSPIQIQNIGGGVLTVSSVSCGAPWCSAGSFSSSLTGGASTQVTISVSAAGLASGVYRTSVTVTSSAGSASVPITFLVTDNAMMTLTPSGTRFDMAAGGQPGNVHGSSLVVAAGGAINWSAAVKDESPWLTLETTAGSSSLDVPGAVTYSINSSASTLAAGAYYATIEVTSPDASNSPQDYQIVLNVATANAPPHLTPSPGGLTFDGNTTSQVITVYSTSSAPTAYQASASTINGGNWLSVTPTGSASSSAPGASTVTIRTTGLAAGVYAGSVSIAAASSGISVVNVSLIIPASAPVARVAPADKLAPRDSCTAANVVPTQIGLVNSFSTPASWPTPLAVQLSDDCGNVIGDGQVIATFSNGDPPLSFTLSDAAKGVYSGTWTPRSSTSRITIKARGSKTGLIPATAELSGSVVPNAAPSINLNGVVHPFDPIVGGALAPGTIVAIYGVHLASQPAQPTSIPLPVKLNATSVLIGGIQSPLFYVGPEQINAQIPFELKASEQYQVVVNANGALTAPQPIQLAATTPGIDTFPDGTLVAVHAADGTLISATSPAQRGEYVVLFLLGLGATDNPVTTGDSPPATVLARAAVPPVITINNNPVPVAFAGLSPGFVGLYQVNLKIPDNQPGGNVVIGVSQGDTAGNSGILPIAY